MAETKSGLLKIIEAAGKRKAAETQLKVELAKEVFKSKLRQQENNAKSSQTLMTNLVQNASKNPERYTPEQSYLRRRAMEENPLMAMSVPEEGQSMDQGIRYPTEEVGPPDSKTGLYSAPRPISPERQTQLLQYKVDQMIAEGKKPHPAVLALLQKSKDYQAIQKNQSMTKEDRLLRGQQLQSLKSYGGTLDDNQLKSLGVDMESYARAGGAVPIAGADGKRKWQIMPYEQFKAKVSENKWSKTEVDNFQNRVVENARWKNVLKIADEVGISQDNIADLGSMEFDTFNSPIGPVSIPARFNLYGQYAKDPAYTSLKRAIELAFTAFRKRVTGAQAGERELSILRDIMPSLRDRPEVFFDSIKNLIEGSDKEMQESLELYKSFGRDTSGLEKYMQEQGMGTDNTSSQNEDYKEGDVVANDSGEKLILKNGKWVPYSE